MADDLSIFGRLTGLTPSGKAKDAKEVPVDKDSRRKMSKKKRIRPGDGSGEKPGPEEQETNEGERKSSGKVLDILI